MFKKYSDKEHSPSVNNMKSSVQRGVRAKVITQFPFIEDYIDEILPKKETLKLVKLPDHIELVASQAGQPLFFKHRDGDYYPTLRILHKYPFMLPHMQVDKGAIRFVLSGANIMCPGLTSPGARMTMVNEGTVVAVMAEGKEHALAVGLTTMSSEDILSKNKGIGVECAHFLNDGLWKMKPLR
ncbi:malignant T-cell-amplified sequence 1 homolog [Lineus longissimus]|uniref:malignant T-cell-amplified sequence 1 homolog n=1 Tax=Lineus longissimus TaxID=88925 RepID=UPI002B4C59B0